MNLDLKKKKSRVHPPNVPKVLLGHQYNPCNTMALGWLGIEILVSGKGCEEKHNRQMSIRLGPQHFFLERCSSKVWQQEPDAPSRTTIKIHITI